MHDSFVAAADDIVREGMEKSAIPLTETLRHYIAITLARFIRDHPRFDRLTIRTVEAVEARATPGDFRRLGDECLIATSLFEARLRRIGGSLRHYIGVGQTAYDAARMTEQAWSFAEMRDVIVSGTGRGAERGPVRLRDLADAARAGSRLARETLGENNIVVFPAKRWLQ